MSKVVLCEYFIQNEEAKSKTKKRLYNAFVLPKTYGNIKEVRVEDVKKSFPFNSSEYHFRFQTRMSGIKVWVDTSRDHVAVPIIDEKVRMKLLKLPKGIKPKPARQAPPASTSQPVPSQKSAHENLIDHEPDLLAPSTKRKSIPHSNSQNNINDPNLGMRNTHSHGPMSQGGFDEHTYGGNPSKEDYLNGMDFNLDSDEILGGGGNPEYVHTQSQDATDGGSDNDFGSNLLGDFETNNNTVPQSYNHPNPSSQPHSDGFDLMGGLGDIDFNAGTPKKPEENKKTEEPMSKLQQVKKVFEGEEKDREEWQKAYQKYDHKVKMWKGLHEMNSIKVLLCTLHDVLWKDANWKRVGMHQLMDQNSVKKCYRRAILITHPDRVNKSPVDQKFLANRVFGTLNEAWKVFEKTGI